MKVEGLALPMGVRGAVPTSLLVFPVGEPPRNDDRKWRFTPEDLSAVAAAFAERPDPMPIYYKHGEDAAKGSKAAGWVDSLDLRSDGLYANVRWTDEARREIRSGEWGFRSPGFEAEEDAEGYVRPRALSEVSLVNDPAIGGMPPVVASVSSTTPPQDPAGAKEKDMAETTNVNAAKTKAAAFDGASILQMIRDNFKIPEVIDDKTLGGLVAQALAGGGGEKPEDEMPGASTAPAAPALSALTERLAANERELAALKTSKEIEAVIEAGVKDLKITPALLPTAQLLAQHGGVEALKTYVASLQPTAPEGGQAPVADRKPHAVRHPSDHVGVAPGAYDPARFAVHSAAIAYMEKAQTAGKTVRYRQAVEAVTRKSA